MIAFLARWALRELLWRIAKPLAGAFAGALLVLSGFTCVGGAAAVVGGQGGNGGGGGSVVIPGGSNPTPRPTLVPGPTVPPAPGSFAQQVIAFAMTWLNVPYLWAGCTRAGIDCSCFVMLVFAQFGITIPRNTVAQWNALPHVSQSQLAPLDLVFFANTCTGCGGNPTHVGLYIGNGMMVQAGGAAVSVQPVFSGFYGAHYMGAARVLS